MSLSSATVPPPEPTPQAALLEGLARPLAPVALPDRAPPVAVHRGFHERPGTSDTVAAALAQYRAEHGRVSFPPLVVVIAALNEEANLPAVLEEVPDTIGGVAARVLVVDDGSTDDTAEVARSYGAAVLRLATNCGHGVALRAGYALAAQGGGELVATLDADGQWDPAQLPAMVALVEAGEADFVVGSRALGATEDTDSVRTLGVGLFARLFRVLTGEQVTDTSSGLRVMRVGLLQSVRQTQPQYQTSELLVGAVLGGWRVAEVPTVMRPRTSGESRKGRNLAYAGSYARVMIGTWWRETRDPGNAVRQMRPPLATRLVRYALGSAICLVVSELVLAALVVLGARGWLASIAGSAAGVIPGYPLNRAWTFGRRGRSHPWREVAPYWGSTIFGAVVAAVLVGLADPWARSLTTSAPWRAALDAGAFLGAYGVVWLAKFAFLDRLLFRSAWDEELVPETSRYLAGADGRADGLGGDQ